MERRRADILEAIHRADSGDGVVLLTDMFGGTPSNLAISVMNGGKVEVLAGVNLPMLIKLASVRDSATLEQAVLQAQDAGRKYVYIASRVLNPNDRSDFNHERHAGAGSRGRPLPRIPHYQQKGPARPRDREIRAVLREIRRRDHRLERWRDRRRQLDHGHFDPWRGTGLDDHRDGERPAGRGALDALEALVANRFGEDE